MDKAKKEVLKQLLELIAGSPEVAERITITIRPAKLLEDKPQRKPK